MSENEKKEEAALDKLPELETVCPECDGRCFWEKRGRCQKCNGIGVVPTEFGRRVLELVVHHRQKILLEDNL